MKKHGEEREVMTKREAIVLSAYTGVLLCDLDDYRTYAEKLFGCSLNTAELLMLKEDIQERATEDAMKIINSMTDETEAEVRQEELSEELEGTKQNSGQMVMT